MKIIVTFILTISFSFCTAQSTAKFNLGFENHQDNDALSDGWFKWGSYDLEISELAYSGKKSGKISSGNDGDAFGSIAYKIPANYNGKTIKLEGYMKIENVEGGFAGLLLRIDGGGGSLAFDNMQSQDIKGTRDWQKYTIDLDYPEEADQINVAGLLVGSGTAWFDDFRVTIDGEDIQTLKEAEKPVYKADLDKEFDDGSNISMADLSQEKIADLALMGRVWGFLKYHHPEIAAGNYNWDYELFRILPKYLESKSTADRDVILVEWIDGLGKVEKCSDCPEVVADAFAKPDNAWIDKQNPNLKKKLLQIYEGRNNGKHFYIGKTPGVGNPQFRNESAYMDMTYPDDGFRLLSVFRYWNMIHYFFPYKHLMDKDWNTVLMEYIPKFLDAENELEYEIAALKIIGDIQDTHANLRGGADHFQKWKGKNYAPVHVRFIEDQLVVTDIYNPELLNEKSVSIGDVISHISGQSVSDIVKEKSQYYPASNIPTRLRDMSADMLRSNEEILEVTHKNSRGEHTSTIQLYPRDSLNIYRWFPRDDDKKSFEMLDNNIGYITLQTIKESDIAMIKDTFETTDGIILDIRNYPSTFVPFSLGSYFLSEPTPFVKFTVPNTTNPGEFYFTDLLEIPTEQEGYKGKLVVLLNEFSQSQAEYTSMAFRAAPNTTIIGSTTAGADGNVSRISLPGQLKTMISGIGVYYPNGDETQRVGIIPDIEVKPTVEGIRMGKDEVMEKAIEIIQKSVQAGRP